MNKYTLEQFTSRNTSFNRDISKRDFKSACSWGSKISTGVYWPVVIHDTKTKQWAKYEHGLKTEWSFE